MYSRISREGAGKLVDQLFFTPGRLPMPSRFEYLLDEADSHTQLHHGAHILPVYSWGEGPAVLMVHGWSGAGIQFGAYIDPLVRAGYRVVLFDAVGHGRAQGMHTDLSEMADIVKQVGRNVGSLHGIIAHSEGCLAAARAVVDGLESRHMVMLTPAVDMIMVLDRLADTLGITRDLMMEHEERFEARLGRDIWTRMSLYALAPQLEPEGLIVVDRDDDIEPAARGEEVHLKWPGSSLLRTQGLGHEQVLWSPEVLEPVVQKLTTAN